jgi:aldehyde dehydrogenase (NAD+)
MSKQNYINGQWVEGASATRNVNPSNTADVIDEYAQADRAQAESAIAAARAACVRASTSRSPASRSASSA